MIIPNLIPGWGINEEDDAERWQKRQEESARLNAIPEFQKHRRDQSWVCSLLADLLYIDSHAFAMPLRNQSRVAYRMGRVESKSIKPLPYDADNNDIPEYIHFQQSRRMFSSALWRYVSCYRSSQWDTRLYDRAQAETHLGLHTMNVLRQGFKRAWAPYDVGSSLYLYQQMYDRKLSASPSLSRAAWLVKNAPLEKQFTENHKGRSKWERIQEQWKEHFHDSHLWAALVTTTKTPLRLDENSLFDFVCDVDVDHFSRLEKAFYHFRQRVEPPKPSVTKLMYLKQGLSDEEIAPSVRLDPLEIPNPLEDFQWDALSRYPSKTRGTD